MHRWCVFFTSDCVQFPSPTLVRLILICRVAKGVYGGEYLSQ